MRKIKFEEIKSVERPCPTCDGTGWVEVEPGRTSPCPHCGGTGTITTSF